MPLLILDRPTRGNESVQWQTIDMLHHQPAENMDRVARA